MDSTTVQTPALDIIDDALVDVDRAIEAMLKRRNLFARYRNAGMNEIEARECAEAEVPSVGTDRLIVSMPPQEGKSERCSHYGALFMLRRHPELRIAIVSYEERIAQRMSYLLRNDLETFDGQEGNFDVGLRLRKDNRSVGSWNLQGHRGSVYAIGIGGALTGRPVDLLIIDDPVKDYSAADSSLLSDQAWQWWQSVARARLAPGAPTIVILTRWHESDMAGRLIAKQHEDEKSELKHFDRWRVINIPAQADYNPPDEPHDPYRFDPLGRKPGEFMVSARGRTQAQWEATKAATSARIWSALFQGKPTPDSGDVFHKNWWMRFSTPMWNTQPDASLMVHDVNEVLISLDCAFKETSTSDFVVFQVWARKGAFMYLIDQVRGRMDFSETCAVFDRLCKKWPQAVVKLIEDKANGPAVITTFRKQVGGIIPITPKDSKPARARAVSPFVESNNVFLPTTEIALYDVESFIDECTQFPNAAHDDQVDAMTQALHRVYIKNSQTQEYFDTMAKTCPNCNELNVPLAQKCVKCGEEFVKNEEPTAAETAQEESEKFDPFNSSSAMPQPNNSVQAVMDAIAQFGPQNNNRPSVPVPPWARR